MERRVEVDGHDSQTPLISKDWHYHVICFRILRLRKFLTIKKFQVRDTVETRHVGAKSENPLC